MSKTSQERRRRCAPRQNVRAPIPARDRLLRLDSTDLAGPRALEPGRSKVAVRLLFVTAGGSIERPPFKGLGSSRAYQARLSGWSGQSAQSAPRTPLGSKAPTRQSRQRALGQFRPAAAGSSVRSFIMAFVRVEQRNAHLASGVRLVSVQGRDGQPVSKATLTAVSGYPAVRQGSRALGRRAGLGPDRAGTHPMRRTKATLIYRRTKNPIGQTNGHPCSRRGWPASRTATVRRGPRLAVSTRSRHSSASACRHAAGAGNRTCGFALLSNAAFDP
jgi:hypothetical protein